MSDIYHDLYKLVFLEKNDNLNIYNGHKDLIKNYLLEEQNHENVKALFKFIAEIHQKSYVFNLLDKLKLYESELKNILPNHREHYKHSVNVYILGLALYNNCELIREAVKISRHSYDDNEKQRSSFLFRWSLAASLHDLAYPLEMSIKTFNKYLSHLTNYEKKTNNELTIKNDIIDNFNKIPKLKNDSLPYNIPNKTALGLITNYLLNVEQTNFKKINSFDNLYCHLNDEISSGLKSGKIDHGIFSSLIILKRIYELYEKNDDWPVYDFYYEVVDSATAIFLHNFYQYSDLNNILNYDEFNYDKPSPLGYLLALCDEMCEWDRNKQNDGEKYRIDITEQSINFSVPKDKKEKLIKKIDLLNKDININVI